MRWFSTDQNGLKIERTGRRVQELLLQRLDRRAVDDDDVARIDLQDPPSRRGECWSGRRLPPAAVRQSGGKPRPGARWLRDWCRRPAATACIRVIGPLTGKEPDLIDGAIDRHAPPAGRFYGDADVGIFEIFLAELGGQPLVELGGRDIGRGIVLPISGIEIWPVRSTS